MKNSLGTVLTIVSTTTSVTLSVVGIGLVVVPLSARIACSLSLANKKSYKIMFKKYKKHKKQYERDQQKINLSIKL